MLVVVVVAGVFVVVVVFVVAVLQVAAVVAVAVVTSRRRSSSTRGRMFGLRVAGVAATRPVERSMFPGLSRYPERLGREGFLRVSW